MSIAIAPPDEAVSAAAARHDLVVGLTDAGIYFETHQEARLPQSPVVNVRVRGANRDEKLADLAAIADSWGVIVATHDNGTKYAERVFGPVTFEAHVMPEPKPHVAYLAEAKQLRERQAAAASSGCGCGHGSADHYWPLGLHQPGGCSLCDCTRYGTATTGGAA